MQITSVFFQTKKKCLKTLNIYRVKSRLTSIGTLPSETISMLPTYYAWKKQVRVLATEKMARKNVNNENVDSNQTARIMTRASSTTKVDNIQRARYSGENWLVFMTSVHTFRNTLAYLEMRRIA